MFIALALGLGSCQRTFAISDGLVYSYAGCADGWDSPSIGRQGACSNHGGVVEYKVDKRTSHQKALCLRYNLFAFVCFAIFFVVGLSRLAGDLELANPSIPIEGNTAFVPLTIAGETKTVKVQRVNEKIYETEKDVALVRCPEGKRKSIYISKIQFRGENGKYRRDLSTWMYTGRGRIGGYTAIAFAWNPKYQSVVIPMPSVSEDTETAPN